MAPHGGATGRLAEAPAREIATEPLCHTPRRLLAPRPLCVTLESTVILVLLARYVNFRLAVGGSGGVDAAPGSVPQIRCHRPARISRHEAEGDQSGSLKETQREAMENEGWRSNAHKWDCLSIPAAGSLFSILYSQFSISPLGVFMFSWQEQHRMLGPGGDER